MNGADRIARGLKAEGVEFITGFPLNHVFDSAAAVGIRPIIARTETVAINMADGFARMKNGRQPGVVAFQYGPGSEAAFAGIAQAYSDNSPILCLSGATELSRFSTRPNFSSGRSFEPITKWSATIVDAAQTDQMFHHAMVQLRSGRRGPVLLELPSDVLLTEVEIGPNSYPTQREYKLSGGAPADVENLARAIAAADFPVIYAGQGVHFAEAWDELVELAELTGLAVITSLNGKSVFPENHPLSAGVANGFSRSDSADYFLEKADLLIGVGTSFTKSKFIAPIPPGKTLAQIVNDESDIGKDYPVELAVIGDAKFVLRKLCAQLRELGLRQRTQTHQTIKELRENFIRKWQDNLTSEETPINPYRVIWDLMQCVDRERTVVTHDSGSPRDQMVPFFESVVPRGYLSWGKSTPLGAGLGLVMGAKLANPGWLAVNVMGEAAFGMVGMDFETAVRERIPILTIVINNGKMGGYSTKQPVASERYGLNELTGDYSAVAKALGGHGERVSDPKLLQEALRRCIDLVEAGTPSLLEVMCSEETSLPNGVG